MKIHIVGGPGSGKTYLARKLSRELGILHYDLDDVQWANESGYGKKRDTAERDALLALLQRSREQTAAEIKNKGQVYRSVGYLTGVAALLLVL